MSRLRRMTKSSQQRWRQGTEQPRRVRQPPPTASKICCTSLRWGRRCGGGFVGILNHKPESLCCPTRHMRDAAVNEANAVAKFRSFYHGQGGSHYVGGGRCWQCRVNALGGAPQPTQVENRPAPPARAVLLNPAPSMIEHLFIVIAGGGRNVHPNGGLVGIQVKATAMGGHAELCVKRRRRLSSQDGTRTRTCARRDESRGRDRRGRHWR